MLCLRAVRASEMSRHGRTVRWLCVSWASGAGNRAAPDAAAEDEARCGERTAAPPRLRWRTDVPWRSASWAGSDRWGGHKRKRLSVRESAPSA
jgi:hypothetical protein